MSQLFGAVELGGSKVLCAVGTSARTVGETSIVTGAPAQTMEQVAAFFAPHAQELGAVGVAAFGPLELAPDAAAYGTLLTTPKAGWSGFPLVRALRERLGTAVALDTDVNAAALAEQRLGAARGKDPCVYVTVGTGIGVGVVIEGRPLHGLLHPELGHLPAPALSAERGVCPYHERCIEGVASAPALRMAAGRAPEDLDDDHPVWNLEARYLAHLLAAAVLAYSPRCIVLGGGVLLRRGLRERVRAELCTLLGGYVPRAELSESGISEYVVAPKFEQRAGLIGAFLLAERG